MQRALLEREGGLASLEGAAAFGHRPHRFHGAALGDAGLASRLVQTAALAGHSGAVNALTWTEAGELLASGGEDCRLRLWRGIGGELLHSVDTGHTANILSTCFLPGSRGDQLICCSADRQIRHLNVTKGAVRPYLVHSGSVRSVLPLDAHLFLSASEDGTVREFDVRQRPVAVHREALAGDDSNVLVDQRAERVGRSRVRVGIYSLAVDPHRPWLMLTGGTDPLLRLYDRRMLVGPSDLQPGARSKAPQWVACYVPSHLKAALWDSGRHPALVPAAVAAAGLPPPGHHVTSVAFARGGSEVVGSFAGELIYSFDVAQHARDVESLLHIPQSVLRATARPRSHVGRRSMHNFAPSSQGPHLQSPLARGAAAAAEGAGGTVPQSGEQPLAAARAHARQLRQQQQQRQQRSTPGRGIAIAPSVRQLERQRRQQSRVAAAAATAEPLRAESSRPAHWQMHPTSSTLRSPHNQPRLHPHQGSPHQQQRHHHQQRHHQQQAGSHQQPHEFVSDSEGLSEGVSPEGQHHALLRQGVRRSRRIMRRRRDAAEAFEQQAQGGAVVGEAAVATGAATQQAQEQLPTVSEVAEPAAVHPAPASSSDGAGPDMCSPATRRRVRRRTLAGSAAVHDSTELPEQQQESTGLGTALAAAVAAGAQAGGAAGAGAGGTSAFKAPVGRSPHMQRRQAAAAAAAAVAAATAAVGAGVHRLDSTLGLLHHQGPQLEASEVAAGGRGGGWGAQQALQEATVSMGPGDGRTAGAVEQHGSAERFAAMEVSSRPLPAGSLAELATQLGSQQAGHEASSLNSAEQPANERVGSVAQRHRADAPSVGNAPVATTAAATGTAAGTVEQRHQQQPAVEGNEASTGHNLGPRTSFDRLVLPPPQFAAHGQQQQQHPRPQAVPRQRQQLQPTASTGTSRPPAYGSQQQQQQQAQQQRYLPPQASGRQGSRLRRHSAGAEAAETAVAGAAGTLAAGPALAAEQQQQQQQPRQQIRQAGQPLTQPTTAQHAPSVLQQPQPQATMLSGRGPSVLGDFMPVDQQAADSEIEQRQASVAADGPAAATAQQQRQEQEGGAGETQDQQQPRRGPIDSNIGAIVHNADADGGEEVSEPTMFRRCYMGHLNQSPALEGVPLAPQLALLGPRSELLASPSDDGNLFIWDYVSGRLVAVLPSAGAPGLGAPTDGGGAIAGACVAPHPLLPVLASGGMDSIVRLWSPEAEQQCSMQHIAGAVHDNLRCLQEAGMQIPVGEGLADGLLLGGSGQGGNGGRGSMRSVGGSDRGGRPQRCNIM